MTVDAFPLSWPSGKPRTRNPQRSRFDVNFTFARDELLKEIRLLGGRLPILSSNIPLRRDGLPYAGQKAGRPRRGGLFYAQRPANVLLL